MSIKYDRAQKKYSYFDKNGVEIHAGDTIRRDGLGGVDKVYEWESEDGVRGLGTDATSPVWINDGRAVPCEFGIYPLDEADCATSEVLRDYMVSYTNSKGDTIRKPICAKDLVSWIDKLDRKVAKGTCGGYTITQETK